MREKKNVPALPKSIPLEKQIAMKRSMYYQLCFCTARAQRSFADQESKAEAALYFKWQQNGHQLQHLQSQRQLWEREQQVAATSEILQHQIDELHQSSSASSETRKFKSRVNDLMVDLKRSLNFLPTSKIDQSTVDITDVLNQCTEALDDIGLTISSAPIKSKEAATLMQTLVTDTTEAWLLAKRCANQMQYLRELHVREQSLLVHHLQSPGNSSHSDLLRVDSDCMSIFD